MKSAHLALLALLLLPVAVCESISRADTIGSAATSIASASTANDHSVRAAVDRLEAIEEIKQLKARYWRTMDEKKWDEFENVFTDDVIFDLREALFARDWHSDPNNPTYVLQSGDMVFTQEQINSLLRLDGGWYVQGASNVRQWEQGVLEHWVTVHHGHTPEITIDSPTTARALWRLEHNLRVPRINGYASNPLYFWLPDNLPSHEYHAYGIYDERYEKTADGWKIKSLKLTHYRVDIK